MVEFAVLTILPARTRKAITSCAGIVTAYVIVVLTDVAEDALGQACVSANSNNLKAARPTEIYW